MIRSIAVCFAFSTLVTITVAAQTPVERLRRARALLTATEVERGVDALRDLLRILPPSADDSVRTAAHLELGVASLSLGLADSAVHHFASVIRVNPFFVLQPGRYNPDVETSFVATRAGTAVIGFRLPSELVVSPAEETWPIDLAIGASGNVTFRFTGADDLNPRHIVTMVAEESGPVDVSLMINDSTALPPGDFVVSAIMASDNAGRDSTFARITVSRLQVDTTAHQLPPDPLLFRAETRKGPIVISSIAQGVIAGVAASLIPVFITNPDLKEAKITGPSIGVGVAIGLGGVAGSVLARRDLEIEENVNFNRDLLSDWEIANTTIATDNERIRRLGPLHIQVVNQ